MPVFISSTYTDLVLHRAETERRLVGLEQIVKGMEFFGSSPTTPLETCVRQLSDCKLLILIIGVSYGSIEETTGQSFTELEYDYAISNNIPVLVYLADTASPTVGIALDSFDTENFSRLEHFKEKLRKTHTVSLFTSVDDLGKRIEHDVPETLRKLEDIQLSIVNVQDNVTDEMLKEGAEKFEMFWLRPSTLASEVVPLRLRINKKWGGWKVKDELIQALGLEVGDTVSTEITAQLTAEMIDDNDDTDLFASGEGATWLLANAATPGSIIDCYVRFSYCKAPVGVNNKIVNKVSLVFVKGIKYVGFDKNYALSSRGIGLNELMARLAAEQ